MSEFKEYNSYMEMQNENGDVERHYPYTKYDNIEDIPKATEQVAAPVKLYTSPGNNDDGTLTQKVISEMTSYQKSALMLLAANAFIIDDENGLTYKIGSKNGKLYLEDTDISVKEIVEMIAEAAVITLTGNEGATSTTENGTEETFE